MTFSLNSFIAETMLDRLRETDSSYPIERDHLLCGESITGEANTRSRPGGGPVFDRLVYFITEVIAPNGNAFALTQQGNEPGAQFLAGRSIAALVLAERFLTGTRYIASDTFTLADIAAYTSAFAVRQKIDWSVLPLLRAWYARIGARPGVVRGMAAF